MTALPTRADYVAGLRELADFIEATDLPVPTYQMGLSGSLGVYANYARDDEASVAQVARAAQVLGVELVSRDVDTNRHHTADRRFGPIELHFSYVENGAAKDIPGAGDEVVGPAAGSATAPTETDAQPSACLEEVGGSDSGQGKAEPPTEPDVWLARRRRGIAYHGFHGLGTVGQYTACGRAARANGHRLTRAEAESFGAVPCDRCYGEQVSA